MNPQIKKAQQQRLFYFLYASVFISSLIENLYWSLLSQNERIPLDQFTEIVESLKAVFPLFLGIECPI